MGCMQSKLVPQTSRANFNKSQETNSIEREKRNFIDDVYITKLIQSEIEYFHRHRSIPYDHDYRPVVEMALQQCCKDNIQKIIKVANLAFKSGYIQQAVKLYQKAIEQDPNKQYPTQGLGNFDMSVTYYQFSVCEWYNKQKGKGIYKNSPYDALSLCFIVFLKTDFIANKKFIKKGLKWYSQMIKANPKYYQLVIGYANILYLLQSYDEAITFYNEALQIKPDLINALVSLMFIYQLRRVDKTKSVQLSNTILKSTDDNNCYAAHIKAWNISNVDQKIKQLKAAHLKYPEYTQITNLIGVCCSDKNNRAEAIEWWKKCIQQYPHSAVLYNNVGFTYKIMENYQQARVWYYQAVQKEPYDVDYYKNLINVYEIIKFTDHQIEKQINNYNKLNQPLFCCQLGNAFKQKKKLDRAQIWGKKAIQKDSKQYLFYFNLGLTLKQKMKYGEALANYNISIELNLESDISYNNAANIYKTLNNMDKAIEMYIKAIQINPSSVQYYNLGNLYKEHEQYENAIQSFQNAVKYDSKDSVALVSLAVCYEKTNRLSQASQNYRKAQLSLTNDKTIDQQNTRFVQRKVNQFKQKNVDWGKNGYINNKQKQVLNSLRKDFQDKFKKINSASYQIQILKEMTQNKGVHEIIQLIKKDQYALIELNQIFKIIISESAQKKNTELFHIVTLMIIQNFMERVSKKQRIPQIEKDIKTIIEILLKNLGQNIPSQNKPQKAEKQEKASQIQTKVKAQQIQKKVNILKKRQYFKDFESIFDIFNSKQLSQPTQKLYFDLQLCPFAQTNTFIYDLNKNFIIVQLFQITQHMYQKQLQRIDFSLFVKEIRQNSKGIPAGISTKIPNQPSEQFKVILRIIEKMFGKQLKTDKIISKIEEKLNKSDNTQIEFVVQQIIDVWNEEITQILVERNKDKIPTQCYVDDLIRGKCMYKDLKNLKQAVDLTHKYCKQNAYEVLQIKDRLSKPQTQDIMFKIKIRDAVCQLQLAMVQDQTLTKLDHSLYEIKRSPLGCIFGSYLFASKQVKYPLVSICKGIIQNGTNGNDEDKVKQSAQYIVETFTNKNKSN